MTFARLGLALLAVVVGACEPPAADERPSAPGSAQQPSAAKAAADLARCHEGAAFAVAPLTVEWQQGEAVHRLALGSDGKVQRDGAPFGRFEGSCLLDTSGAILNVVDAQGRVTDRARTHRGTFRSNAPLQYDGKAVPVTEVWSHPDGEGLAVDDDGTVFVVPRSGEPFTLPAGVEGRLSQARRAALLLLVVRSG